MKAITAMAILVLALIATSLAPSVAQTKSRSGHMMGGAGSGCPIMGMMGPGRTGQGTRPGNAEQMGRIADRRLVDLETELKITDGQADVWKAYVDTVKAQEVVMHSLRRTMMDAMDKGGAIERMDARIKSMEAMVKSMIAVKPATERLHATLTAEQKSVADQVIGVGCGAM